MRSYAYRDTPEGHRKRSDQGVAYRIRIKTEVLSFYSDSPIPHCVVCGESRLECLSLDHIKNDGYKDGKRGFNLYIRIRREGYPGRFMTLCMNCQYVKRNEYDEKQRQKRLSEYTGPRIR